MKTYTNGMGYVIADNRASDWGTIEEADLIGCNHCHCAMKKPAWQADGAFCHVCDRPICPNCAEKPGCTPYVEKLQRAINEDYRRRQLARMLGI